jgi:CRISPR/Cas system-associated exonuclease Cas4 (RecB family)
MATPETQNLFLNTKAEVEIKLKTKEEVNITGRLDFIHTNPISNEVLIFDGKGTDKIKKNIDENQLLYYMLLYWFLYKEIPQQTGFFYYRFNLFAPMVVGVSQINKFRAQLSLDIKALLKESEFKATPSYTVCKYCGYKATCKEKEDREKISKKPSKITNLPESGGIVQFSF